MTTPTTPMPENRSPRPWPTHLRADGELMVPLADVLAWLRECEEAWSGTLPERPTVVVAHLADTLRDVWLEGVPRP